MSDHVDTVTGLAVGDRVRVETDTATTVEAQVTGRPYTSDTRVRIELSVATDDGSYRLGATRDDGDWTPVELRRADNGSTVWASMGEVVGVEQIGESAAGEPADVE